MGPRGERPSPERRSTKVRAKAEHGASEPWEGPVPLAKAAAPRFQHPYQSPEGDLPEKDEHHQA